MRGTTGFCWTGTGRERISIHVPLAGDDASTARQAGEGHISIHVPLAGDDVQACVTQDKILVFLSTSPLRGTTVLSVARAWAAPQFLSTSPLRGTTISLAEYAALHGISIHVPLAGDDSIEPDAIVALKISIHVPLAGDDLHSVLVPVELRHFYPRPPCGGRLAEFCRRKNAAAFLSTSPLRGTTGPRRRSCRCAPHFYPRPPCGGRRFAFGGLVVGVKFLSTSPLRGTTRYRSPRNHLKFKFLSTSPLRGTTPARFDLPDILAYFYPRPPCGGRR